MIIKEDQMPLKLGKLFVAPIVEVVALAAVLLVAVVTVFSLPITANGFHQVGKQITKQKSTVLLHLKTFYKDSQLSKPNILKPIVVDAKEGEVAVGIVIYEEKDQSELDLDSQPCNAVMKVFTKPYKKKELSETVTCGGRTEKKVQVTQARANDL